MLTPRQFREDWLRFAAEKNLAASEDPAEGGAPRSLAMAGTIDGVAVKLTYEPRREARESNAAVTLEGVPIAAPRSMQEVLGHVLLARGVAAKNLGGKITVGLDPVPTFRKVASLAGGGDPTVGDKEFDDRFLLEGDEAQLRAALNDGVRAGLKALQKVPCPMQLVVEGAQVTLHCFTVARGPQALAAALDTLVAACR